MPDRPTQETTSIPIAAEEIRVTKSKEVTGTVRVTKATRVEQRTVEEPVHHEKVTVERRPVDRWVEGPLPSRQEGDTTIIPLVEEVVVVEKKFRLIEEVLITRHVTTRTFRQTVDVRHNEVSVERIAGDGATPLNRSSDQ